MQLIETLVLSVLAYLPHLHPADVNQTRETSHPGSKANQSDRPWALFVYYLSSQILGSIFFTKIFLSPGVKLSNGTVIHSV